MIRVHGSLCYPVIPEPKLVERLARYFPNHGVSPALEPLRGQLSNRLGSVIVLTIKCVDWLPPVMAYPSSPSH